VRLCGRASSAETHTVRLYGVFLCFVVIAYHGRLSEIIKTAEKFTAKAQRTQRPNVFSLRLCGENLVSDNV
jgi:hypothetical protein